LNESGPPANADVGFWPEVEVVGSPFLRRCQGQADIKCAYSKQLPRAGDLFHTGLDGKNIRIRVTSQVHAPPPHLNGVFQFNADQIEDDGNPDGHGEFGEDDF
jgi:hypothetical protein